MTETLKPCPFCGGEALANQMPYSSYYGVGCNDCDMSGQSGFLTIKDAVATWNTRPEQCVKVKPLEWEDDNDEEVWTKAVTQIGTYFICEDTDDFTGLYVNLISHDRAKWWQHVRSTCEVIMDHYHGDDVSMLKAAAQADYERRLLSAINTRPEQCVDVEALMRAM